jgi:DNA-binding response OmpR family regulator
MLVQAGNSIQPEVLLKAKTMSAGSTILVVDDEENIRSMLRLVLESEGFVVTTAGSVPQALTQITQFRFDVLISDLNIGHPADGFLVVSAMRRVHPETLTFILTGYPAFETALEAMRQHVNDYLIKGTPIEDLVEKIKTGLAQGLPNHRQHRTQRVPDVIGQNRDWVIAHWLQGVKQNQELLSVSLSEGDRRDHVPGLLDEAIAYACDQAIGVERQQAAIQHGTVRYHQGYTIPMLIVEACLLQDVFSDCIRRNVQVIDLSNLVLDLTKMFHTVSTELELSVRAFTNHAGWYSPHEPKH